MPADPRFQKPIRPPLHFRMCLHTSPNGRAPPSRPAYNPLFSTGKLPVNDILVGKSITTPDSGQVNLLAKYGNRHGLVAGATGTGKSVTLMVLAEGFSRQGVPVFLADVKGDIAGLAVPGASNEKIAARVAQIGIDGYANEGSPTVFWDVFGKDGHPVRATISEIGPTLLARMLELNDTQAGVLDIVFKLADDNGWLLLDIDDLRSLLNFAAEERKEISTRYGLISPASIGAIQRALLRLEQDGGNLFFGEPALDLNDLMRTDFSGRGVVNILAADKLILKPRLYSTFLLWLLSELFENLPEVGDLDRPKLVFIFDEAHLLFDDAPPALRQRVEQVIRIIRSKGVGVYFCSQFPDDVPTEILGQLGNRVQHALRAFTPRDQKAVKTAAQTFVQNPHLDVVQTISQLGTGEALTSLLMDKGIPSPVEKTLICPPRCRMGAITPEERATIRSRSPVGGRYNAPINRESAHEILLRRAEELTAAKAAEAEAKAQAKAKPADAENGGMGQKVNEWLFGTKRRQGVVDTMAKQTARTVGTKLGNQILRGVLGGIFKR